MEQRWLRSMPEAHPRISIIVNVYNGAQYLEETIESVLAQTFDDWELILWDDRSTDASAAICQRHAGGRIRYCLAEEHVGIGQARASALRLARAPWCAFLDQDDLWSPDKLARQYRLIEGDVNRRLGLVYCRTMRFDRRGRERDFDHWHEFSRLPEGRIFEELVRRPSFIALSSALLRVEGVEKIGGIPMDITYCPDYYLFVMLAREYEAACVQEPCCRYRVHEANMSDKYVIPIHWEILDIISRCAQEVDPRVLKWRQRIHRSLIGLEEIKSGKAPLQGLRRIVREGSVAYLAARPFRNLARSARRMMRRL